ncbi:MAG: zinc transporter ZupT, partial [Planctomycetota bacterium]
MGSNVALALLLTTLAGLSTGLGGLLGILVRKPGPRVMASTLGFAAGVMIYVSFVELLARAVDSGLGFVGGNVAFFAGFGAMFLIDVLIPHTYFGERVEVGREGRLLRTGILVALGLGIHNFPEGLATFAGTLKDPHLGGAIAFAIAIHNIPEGLAVAAPIAATGRRGKAFLYSFLSGLAEPAGALVAAAVLYPFLSETMLGWFMGIVAGFMVYVALDELVPASREYGHGHWAIISAAAG